MVAIDSTKVSTGSKPAPWTHSLAIVGLGPKGFYCLERVLAEYKASSLRSPLRIHLFNRSPNFGASPVYDPDQPDYIAANINVGEVDLWEAPDPPCVAGRGPNFIHWYQETIHPAQRLTGEEYLSRGILGRYLRQGFQRLIQHVPEGVTLECHVAEVIDICPRQSSYELKAISEAGVEGFYVDKILLATGHSTLKPGSEERGYQSFCEHYPNTKFIPFVYPVELMMNQVSRDSTVALKGMGLTFIDTALALTEGRGGRFERRSDGSLFYIPSGQEPRRITPFCRSGLPMVPKPARSVSLPPFTFLTPQLLAQLKERSVQTKLDLEQEIWPWVELEMMLCYYRIEIKTSQAREKLIACGDDPMSLRHVIQDYHRAHPDLSPFDYEQVLDPIGDRRFADGEKLNRFIKIYMEEEISRAHRGPTQCGIRAAFDIWYRIRKFLGLLIAFGGLTPESHRRLLEHYFPRFKRVSLGPPIYNIEKILALLNAGVLDFSVARSPQLRLNKVLGCFEFQCDQTSGTVIQADVLIDSRYPAIDIDRDTSSLYQNLLRRGMIRSYQNTSLTPGQAGYCSGAIDMTEHTQFVVDQNGHCNPDIAVVGIPTEGNLIGNFAMLRDPYSAIWGAEVIRQFREREEAWYGSESSLDLSKTTP